MHTKKSAPLGLAVLVTAVGTATVTLSGCGGAGDAEEGNIVTVDLAFSTSSALNAIPFAVATEEGFFEENGCRLGTQIEEEQGGANTLRNVIDGGLDMGEVATNAVLEGFLAGTDLTVVGSGHQLEYDFTYAVKKGSGITSFKDMEGKRIGFTSPGSASEDISYLLTDASGFGIDAVDRTPTNGMGGGIALLEGGDIDATLMIPILLAQNADKFELGFSALDVIGPYQKTVYIASNEFAEQNPEAVRCILDGLNQATKFIQNDPAAAAEIYTGSSEDYTQAELETEIGLAVDAGALNEGVGFNIEGLEAVARARELRTGEPTQVPWSELIDTSFLPDGVNSELPSD